MTRKITKTVLETIKAVNSIALTTTQSEFAAYTNFKTKAELKLSLSEKDFSKSEKANICFANFVNSGDVSFLSAAANLDAKYIFSTWMAKLDMSGDVLKALEQMSALDKKQFEIFQSEAKKFFDMVDFTEMTLSAESIELYSYFVNPSKVHELNKFAEEHSTIDTIHGWKVRDVEILKEDAVYIKDHEGKAVYGYIAASYQDDKSLKALEKGFASRAKGAEGVKQLDEALFEVKMAKTDSRLHTSKLHENEHGELLLFFDNIARHKAISKLVNKSKLEIISSPLGKVEESKTETDSKSVISMAYSVFSEEDMMSDSSLEVLGDMPATDIIADGF